MVVPCQSLTDVFTQATGYSGGLAIVDVHIADDWRASHDRGYLRLLNGLVPLVLLLDPAANPPGAADLGTAVAMTKPFGLDALRDALDRAAPRGVGAPLHLLPRSALPCNTRN